MEKNKIVILIGALSIILSVAFLFGQIEKPVENIEKQEFSKQTLQVGEVVIIATPKTLAFNKKPVFDLQFDTHTVELTFDIAKSSYLLEDRERKLTGASWQGSPPGGHHRSGQLIFPATLTETDSVELVIEKDLDNQEVRFRWDLKGGE